MKRDRYGQVVGVPTLHVLPTGTVTPLQFAGSGCMRGQGLEMADIKKAVLIPGIGEIDDFWARTSSVLS